MGFFRKAVLELRDHPAIIVVGGLLGFAGAVLALYDRFAPGPWDEQLRPQLQTLVRAAHVETADADRASRLGALVKEFGAANRLREDEVEHEIALIDRSLTLGDESVARGGILFKNGDPVAAKREYSSAVRADPGNALAWSSLGATAMLLGDKEGARQAYDEALKIAPDDWRVRYNFGLFFARTGRPEEGLPHLRLALEFLETHPEHRRDLNLLRNELRTDAGLAKLRATPGFAELGVP